MCVGGALFGSHTHAHSLVGTTYSSLQQDLSGYSDVLLPAGKGSTYARVCVGLLLFAAFHVLLLVQLAAREACRAGGAMGAPAAHRRLSEEDVDVEVGKGGGEGEEEAEEEEEEEQVV